MNKNLIAQTRKGFTLVEMLGAIAIIGILTGMVMFTLAGAREDAKRSKTKATIEKINSVILQKFEEFRYRTVKLPIPRRFTQRNFGLAATANRPEAAPLLKPRTGAFIRTVLLKDYMRMEMPDRRTDLTYSPTNVLGITLEDPNQPPVSLDDFGGRYCPRDYNLLRNYFNLNSVTEPYRSPNLSVPTLAENLDETAGYRTSLGRNVWSNTWESAECLYAIVSHSFVAGGSALESFHASEIGDVDNDSYPEFIDAWGKPIGWLRWPAGYPSELNSSYKEMVGAMPANPDAFDPYRTNPQWLNTTIVQKPWTLIPLIVSAGPDGTFGTSIDTSNFALTHDAYEGGDNPVVGAVMASSMSDISDNITNHDILLE